MANLKKKEQQINENVLIRDIKRADCIKRGSKYRGGLWWIKDRCPMTDNRKEGVRDYDNFCKKFNKAFGAELEIYSKNKGVKDLPINKIDSAITARVEREQRIEDNRKVIEAISSPIINNTTTVVEKKSGIDPGWVVVGVLTGAIIGGIIGYLIRAKKEKEDKKKEKE